MPSMWEAVGYVNFSHAKLNSLGFFSLKDQGTSFVEKTSH